MDKKIKDLEAYSNISEEDYHNSLQFQGELAALKGKIDNIHERISAINQKIEELNKDISGENEDYINEIYKDYARYNGLEEEKSKLLMDSEENRIEILNSELKRALEKVKRPRCKVFSFPY